MELSPKAIRFLMDALKHYAEDLDRRLEEECLSDDELADLGNDRQYLVALMQGLEYHYLEMFKGSEVLQN